MHKSIAAVATVAIIISSKWMIGTLIISSFSFYCYFFSSWIYILHFRMWKPYTNQQYTRADCMIQHHLSSSKWVYLLFDGKQVSSPLCVCGWYDNLSFPFSASICLICVSRQMEWGRNFNFQHFKRDGKEKNKKHWINMILLVK